jgi:hypothetical protein
MARVTDELIKVSVKRIWAFFKTSAILRKKKSCFITGRALVRVRSNAFLARRVTKVANS